jgi:hypothetical protein
MIPAAPATRFNRIAFFYAQNCAIGIAGSKHNFRKTGQSAASITVAFSQRDQA